MPRQPKPKPAPSTPPDAPVRWRNRIVGEDLVDADQLLANPRNWRVHPKAQQDALEGVLREVGWVQRVIVNQRTGFVVDGHARVAMAISRGEHVPVVYVDLSEEEEALVLATLDPLSAMAGTDQDLLDQLKAGMSAEHLGLFAATDRDLAGGSGGPGSVDAPEPQIDRAEELLAKWRVERGQIWQIGRHRLMCGDCTSRDDVAELMRGESAGLMNTDPPYGVSYANDERPNPGVAKPRVAKDELRDSDLQRFLEAAFSAAKFVLVENAAWYLWHADLTQGFFAAAAAAADVKLHRQIIWVKPVLLLGRGQYHWKHEPCFMGWVEGHQPPDYGRGAGERDQTTVWEINSVSQSDRREFNHSTPKPVELFTIPIIKHLKPGEICYEPFAGSGPQFVAAQQLDRTCYGLEIEPKYCAVILERLQAMGLNPELANDSTQSMPAGDREPAEAVA